MVVGRVFHKTGAALLNSRAPHRVVVLGSSSTWAPADLSVLVGTYACWKEVSDVLRSKSV